MFNLDILKFLSPYSGKVEILPITFFLIILFLSFFSWYFLRKNATTTNWEKNWEENHLDIAQGSIADLSESVATKSENTADVIPGIILIVGLLGTFIGLGLALDKASTILSSADMNNMDNSMGQLMGMMEGLGTKFKTSTWGLIAFLLLKFSFSQNQYNERRLNWVANKVKSELNKIRNQKEQDLKQNQTNLLNAISTLSHNFISSQKEIESNNIKFINEITEKKLNTLKDENVAMIKNQLQNHQSLVEKLTEISEHQIKVLDAQHKQQIDTLSNVINKQDDIINAIDKNSENLEKSANESEKTRIAMDKFVDESLKTINSLRESAQGMSNAAKDIGESASQLQTVINSLSQEMTKLMARMNEDLGNTINKMDKSFISNMEQMTKNLANTIDDMNKSFKGNMTEMSAGLNKATSDISNAVNSLSTSVNNTMDTVRSTIDESMKMQRKSQATFSEISDNLNEKIIEMTELVNKLSGDITSGLKAVSESNRNVISLDKRYNGISDQVEALVKSVELAASQSNSLKPLLQEISQKLPNNSPLLSHLTQIKEHLSTLKTMLERKSA